MVGEINFQLIPSSTQGNVAQVLESFDYDWYFFPVSKQTERYYTGLLGWIKIKAMNSAQGPK